MTDQNPTFEPTRCESAHGGDPTPCVGPHDAVVIVSVFDQEVPGCEWHAARFLASLRDGKVHPGTVPDAAIRVYYASQEYQPFPWTKES